MNRYKGEEINISAKVIDKKKYNDEYFRYLIKDKNNKYYCYTDKEFEISDYIDVVGRVREVDGEKIEHSFNYEKYLNHKKIRGIIDSSNVTFIEHRFTIYSLKKVITNYFNKYFKDESLIIIKGLLLGDSDAFDDEFNDALKTNGILHLFAISGLHISLFISLLSFVLKVFKIKEEITERIIIVFLMFYNVITYFAISILRASLMYLFGVINKKYLNKLFSSLDIVSFTFLLLVIINPFLAFNTGMILSFMVSFIIILLSKLLKDLSNIKQILIISFIANVFTLPIIININYSYNLLTPFINVLYITIVSTLILPLTIIVVIIPVFNILYKYIIYAFIEMIKFTSFINISIRLPYFDDIKILIFYLLLIAIIYSFHNRKILIINISSLLLFLVLVSNVSYYKPYLDINFLYLNDGDSIILVYKDDVIVIDTGDGEGERLTNYLKSKGIKKIDYLIITHNHNDHNGELESLNNNFKIKTMITSIYYDGISISNAKQKEVNDEFYINDLYFLVLNPKYKAFDENDNSLVLYMKYNDKSFLFTGDLSKRLEGEVINNLISNNIKGFDLIKIAHHGSSTSTSEDFIKYLNPEYGIISVGEKRKKSFPSKETINILNKYNVKTHITSIEYSINVKVFKNKILI